MDTPVSVVSVTVVMVMIIVMTIVMIIVAAAAAVVVLNHVNASSYITVCTRCMGGAGSSNGTSSSS
jgi:cytochrome c553